MKRLIALVLLVAVVGGVYADVMPLRRSPRPLVNLPLSSFYQPWVAPFLQPLLRLAVPSLRPPVINVNPGYSRVPYDIPVPPVCGVSCLLLPIQGLAE
jgi:hypothetical protein